MLTVQRLVEKVESVREDGMIEIQENLTHNLQQGAQMKLVLVLVGFLTIILACGAEKPNVTPIGTIATTPTPTPRVIVATTPTPAPRVIVATTPMPTPRVIVATTPMPTPRVIVATTPTPMPSSTPVPPMTPAPTQRVIAADTPVPDHHSRTDGDPGANGYRCPYCNSHTNSYSYASAANTYSHTATPGE